MRLYSNVVLFQCVCFFILPLLDIETQKQLRYIVKLTCTCCEPYDMIENKLLVEIKHMKSIGKTEYIYVCASFFAISFYSSLFFAISIHFFSTIPYFIPSLSQPQVLLFEQRNQPFLYYHYFLLRERERERLFGPLSLVPTATETDCVQIFKIPLKLNAHILCLVTGVVSQAKKSERKKYVRYLCLCMYEKR